MPTSEQNEIFDMAKRIKKDFSDIPIVVLTPFSREVYKKISAEDISAIDYIFSWLGNTDLLVAIVKLIEDKLNIEEDVESVGVQVIIMVEDSIRFYSSLLPHLYKFVLQQSENFATEALNEHQRMLRKRGRPKILLARNYEEAVEYYEKYKSNVLGVITDVSFPKAGKSTKLAGIDLCKYIREKDPYLPLIVESSETENEKYCKEIDASFLNKESKKLPVDLKKDRKSGV